MTIGIIGAGALGFNIAAALARAGIETTLLGGRAHTQSNTIASVAARSSPSDTPSAN